jgi:hypothetical protein
MCSNVAMWYKSSCLPMNGFFLLLSLYFFATFAIELERLYVLVAQAAVCAG